MCSCRRMSEGVAALLRTIGLDEAVYADGQPCPYVTLDGRWSLPPLQGSWKKPAPRVSRHPCRRATRARRLAEIARHIDEQRDALRTRQTVAEAVRLLRRSTGGSPSFPLTGLSGPERRRPEQRVKRSIGRGYITTRIAGPPRRQGLRRRWPGPSLNMRLLPTRSLG